MTPRDPFMRAGWCAWAIVALLLIVVPAACHFSQAQEPKRGGVIFDCRQLTETIADFADFRDTDANVDKVIALLRSGLHGADKSAPARFAVIEREIRRLWAEGLPARQALEQLHKRCTGQLGDMGRDA